VAERNPAPAKYPDDRWTPENWYAAVLKLPLVSPGDRGLISRNVRNMEAWRWNLIALFILGFALVVLVVLELLRLRKERRQSVSMEKVLHLPR
jgi:hypothetical protein